MKNKNGQLKTPRPVSVIISEEAIRRWHIFALENRKKKAAALEEIIKRGTKNGKG